MNNSHSPVNIDENIDIARDAFCDLVADIVYIESAHFGHKPSAHFGQKHVRKKSLIRQLFVHSPRLIRSFARRWRSFLCRNRPNRSKFASHTNNIPIRKCWRKKTQLAFVCASNIGHQMYEMH